MTDIEIEEKIRIRNKRIGAYVSKKIIQEELRIEDVALYFNAIFNNENRCQCSDLIIFKSEGEFIIVDSNNRNVFWCKILGWTILEIMSLKDEKLLIDFILK